MVAIDLRQDDISLRQFFRTEQQFWVCERLVKPVKRCFCFLKVLLFNIDAGELHAGLDRLRIYLKAGDERLLCFLKIVIEHGIRANLILPREFRVCAPRRLAYIAPDEQQKDNGKFPSHVFLFL